MQECPRFRKVLQSFQIWQSGVFKYMYRNIIGAYISPWEDVHQYLMFPHSKKRPQAKFCKVSNIYYFLLAAVDNQQKTHIMKQFYKTKWLSRTTLLFSIVFLLCSKRHTKQIKPLAFPICLKHRYKHHASNWTILTQLYCLWNSLLSVFTLPYVYTIYLCLYHLLLLGTQSKAWKFYR